MKYTQIFTTPEWSRNNRTLRKRELIAFLFILIIIIIIIALSWSSFNRMKEYGNKVQRSYNVLRDYDHLYSSIRDEGGFVRSYIITGDTSFLQAFNTSRDSTHRVLGRITEFVGTDSSKNVLLKKIKTEAKKRTELLINYCERKKQGETISDTAFFYQNKGIMDNIRASVQQAERMENYFMVDRNQQLEIFTSQTRVAITIFSLMMISILIVSMFAILSELNKRIALEEYLKSILDASFSGIQSFQAIRNNNKVITDFRIIQANATSHRIVRNTPKALIDKTFFEVYPPEITAKLFDRFVEVAETGKSATFEFNFTYKGVKGWLQIASVKLGDGLTITFENITASKLSELNSQKYLKALKRSNRELEQFAYVASHDLQEPLRKIRSFIERLKINSAELFTPQSQEYFDRIVKSSTRMQTLINDLLLYSRTGNVKMENEEVNLDTLLNDIINEDFEVTIQQKNATVIVNQLPTLEGIEVQFRQLFQNLLSNSLKFSRPGSPPIITVRCEYLDGLNGNIIPQPEAGEESFCRIYFSDNGIGFDMVEANKMFQIFQRLHGKNEYEGTGIGLAICRKIANNHHGTIIAEGESDKGATFIITLPLKQHASSYIALEE